MILSTTCSRAYAGDLAACITQSCKWPSGLGDFIAGHVIFHCNFYMGATFSGRKERNCASVQNTVETVGIGETFAATKAAVGLPLALRLMISNAKEDARGS
jgi:hypothetical protein